MLAQVSTSYSQKIKAFGLKQSYSKLTEDLCAEIPKCKSESKESNSEYSYSDISISASEQPKSDTDDDELADIDVPQDLLYNEERILKQKGYKKIRKICNTQQGELIEAARLESDENESKKTESNKKVIIKKVSRGLHTEKIAKCADDGMTYCTSKDIIKEALLLNHLTVENQSTCNYIIVLIDFFHCEDFYYLVLEHLGNNSMSLKEFVDKSHQYMLDGSLAVNVYIKVIKFIFWQLFVLMQWMHNDMHCCHLDLKLEHIRLKDVEFITDEQADTVNINPNISIKLCDFGSAEIFKDGKFECDKEAQPFCEIQYESPLILEQMTYNAQKADIWALGMMLFHSCIGRPLYSSLFDSGYIALKRDAIERYLKACGLRKYLKKNMLNVLTNMLKLDQNERYKIMDVIQHNYFKGYYNKYKHRIEQKSQSQRAKSLQQIGKLAYIPCYK